MTDMTEGGTLSALDWAKIHGEHFRFYVALDNYEPNPRNYAYGDAYRYSNEQATNAWVIDNRHPPHNGVPGELMFDFEKCGFLMDDGYTVQATYVTGWNHGGAYFFLQSLPTNFDAAGQPIMRPDGHQVDYHNWALGPRKTFHLKLTKKP